MDEKYNATMFVSRNGECYAVGYIGETGLARFAQCDAKVVNNQWHCTGYTCSDTCYKEEDLAITDLTSVRLYYITIPEWKDTVVF